MYYLGPNNMLENKNVPLWQLTPYRFTSGACRHIDTFPQLIECFKYLYILTFQIKKYLYTTL